MKRLLAFVLLLGAGFYLLYELVGDDFIVTASTPGGDDQGNDPEPARPRGGTGLTVSQGSFGATVEQRGELRFPRVREIAQPDGSIVKETVFELYARDSQPVRDGMQQLDGVEVTLFEDGEPGARIQARQALVELGRDQNGNPSLAANKEISMSDVVFEALPGSKLQGLRLELERARALVDEAELHVYTPDDDVPVNVTFAGKRSATLTGRGLQARLPRDRRGALQRVDVNILSEPVLRTAGVTARARGLLHYAENTARQVARLTLTDEVVLELDRDADPDASPAEGAAGQAGRRRMRIEADQLFGWLARGRRRDADGETSEQMTWRMLQLRGAPATVEVPDYRVSTPRLTVLPGLDGMPYWITASGGASRIEQVAGADASGGGTIHGTSPRRIHLLRGREHLAANHRAFGFPQWTLAPLDDFHAVAFEGASHLEDDERVVDASSGLHVFHTAARQRGVIARGFGDVAMLQRGTERREALRATGNDGFALLATAGREELDLGPPATRDGGMPSQDHRYEIRHGELEARGSGACRLEREDEFAVVTLRSPDRDIRARIQDRDAELTDVRWLRAEFAGRDIRAFDLAGLPARATLVRGGETLHATAPRIEQSSAATLRMLPPDAAADAELWRGLRPEDRLPTLKRETPATERRGRQSLEATAPRIDVHYMGRNQVLIDARAGDGIPARASATVQRAGATEPVEITFEAGRLRALPFVVSPAAMRFHLGGPIGAVGSLPFWAERSPWILGDDVSSVRVEDPGEGTFEGQAASMVLSTAAEACLLLGDPRTLTPASATRTAGDRVVTARGSQVRLYREETVRLQAFRAFPGRSTFLLPEIELHQSGQHDVLSHVLASCRGDIDVTPEAVLFHGPVVTRSLEADGSTSPDGLGIVAESLKMELHPETGEVLRVLGKNVDLDWSRVTGNASDIEMDLRWNRVTATDPDGVTARLANGTVVTGRRVTVDYRTLAFEFFRGRVDR